jgi:hypothetical protein
VIVAIVWIGAVLLALAILAVAGYELWGHARRLSAAASAAGALVPRVQALSRALADGPAGTDQAGTNQGEQPENGVADSGWPSGNGRESTPGGPGRHRADP